MTGTVAWSLARLEWIDMAPMVSRIARIDATTPIRLIDSADGRRTALARLPSGALVARTTAYEQQSQAPLDVTAHAGQLERWLTGDGAAAPDRADSYWRGARPPQSGWFHLDRVPAAVVGDLVRAGAQAHLDAADQGLGARAVDALLDSAVLTVTASEHSAVVTNRILSALLGMGFVPTAGYVVVSMSRGWTRVAAEYGSAYSEPTGAGLTLL